MSDEKGSNEPSKPRLCERCGKWMPPQKRGRPRRWCSQQCRQSAYEERHGLESWKDKQPKVKDLSDVVEAMSDRGAGRDVSYQRSSSGRSSVYKPDDCLNVVGQDLILMATIVDQVIDITRRYGVISTFEGRTLAERVAELVNAVLEQTARVVPVDECPWINPRTPIIERRGHGGSCRPRAGRAA